VFPSSHYVTPRETIMTACDTIKIELEGRIKEYEAQGKMIEAYKFLYKNPNVKKIEYNGEILYNILMEKYDTLLINNLICETLCPSNIIAKLYNSSYEEEYKNKIIYIMNESINKNDKNSYLKMIKRINN
jgi:hypothetical protein